METEVLKRQVRRYVPAAVLQSAKRAITEVASRRVRRAFERAGPEPNWLEPSLLSELESRYPRVPPYRYDPDSYRLRGQERARKLARYLPAAGARTVEVGAADGMVSYHLKRAGARATAVDLTPRVFDHDGRARDAGVEFVQADASEIPLPTAEVDLVCSYNAFEHFADPQTVLREMLRVTRPGGVVYLWFGPLYPSAYGQHQMQALTLPFCHYLFERPVIDAYIAQRDGRPIPYESLNEWSVRDFRALWTAHEAYMTPRDYREMPEYRGTRLIGEFPSCFRSKTESFEDLVLATIEGAFTRTDAPLGA